MFKIFLPSLFYLSVCFIALPSFAQLKKDKFPKIYFAFLKCSTRPEKELQRMLYKFTRVDSAAAYIEKYFLGDDFFQLRCYKCPAGSGTLIIDYPKHTKNPVISKSDRLEIGVIKPESLQRKGAPRLTPDSRNNLLNERVEQSVIAKVGWSFGFNPVAEMNEKYLITPDSGYSFLDRRYSLVFYPEVGNSPEVEKLDTSRNIITKNAMKGIIGKSMWPDVMVSYRAFVKDTLTGREIISTSFGHRESRFNYEDNPKLINQTADRIVELMDYFNEISNTNVQVKPSMLTFKAISQEELELFTETMLDHSFVLDLVLDTSFHAARRVQIYAASSFALLAEIIRELADSQLYLKEAVLRKGEDEIVIMPLK